MVLNWQSVGCSRRNLRRNNRGIMTLQQIERKRELVIMKKASGVAVLMFDSANKLNSLGSSTIVELGETIAALAADNSIKAVICTSGKEDNFIIGADLYEIKKAESFDALLALSKNGQALFNQIAAFNKPFVAAINGACLGGGLECALACHARIATRSPKTILGLPETRLGLIPGLGGTQRLPRVIGLKTAVDMILNATTISAEKALEIGLVDKLLDPGEDLLLEAEKIALKLIDSDQWKEQSDRNRRELAGEYLIKATNFCLADLTPEKAEKLLAISERAVKIRSKGHYPAQTDAINVIRTGLQKGLKDGLEAEAQSFARLAEGEVAANLISLFFNTDLAKASSQALVNKFPGSEVKTIGVLGAGIMGTGMAQLAAARGINVVLKTDKTKVAAVNDKIYQLAMRGAHLKLGGKAENEQEHQDAMDEILDKIKVVSSYDQFADVDLVVECIVEDKEAKAAILKELCEHISDKCVVATNTSSFSISDLAKSTKKPENFLGIHFFQPVDRMPLVEIIGHPGTTKSALACASDFVLRLDKTPLVVKDKPGFLINRLLTIYLFELSRLGGENTPLNWLDESMLDFGMPMGPMQLLDEIGIDVAFAVAKQLEEDFGERLLSPEIFKKLCALKMQGKRSNVGFYLWEGSEKKIQINPDMLEKTGASISPEKVPDDEKARIIDRMILATVDEAARCLEEKVVARPREVDFALILGIGFPAFRGGILKYADQRGLQTVVAELEKMYAHTEAVGTSGKRTVSALLKRYAAEGRGFYSLAGSAKEE